MADIVKTGSARYQGFGKDGVGHISTQSGALSDHPYGFNTRFEGVKGSNPEELLAASHASCFTMALSFALARAGYEQGSLETSAAVTLAKDGDGFSIMSSVLTLSGSVEGIDAEDFERLAEEAKANCPISKVLSCDISLEIK